MDHTIALIKKSHQGMKSESTVSRGKCRTCMVHCKTFYNQG
ncbi:hypothetical protein LAJLEIBI_02871 [[Clostridium] hylemonae DSM 15053]|nr:hypothetical protein LAJLEIBI_02871 [[Clostridium] hylemonae DSM 15053]